jgi:uncharacterized membrane protein YfcA
VSPLEHLAANALAAFGACIQGSVGFGLGLVAAPILALIDPDYVPGPVLFATLPLSILVAVREHDHVDLHGLGWAFAGRIPGTVAGALALALLSATTASVVFGVLVLTAVGLTWAGWSLSPTPPTLVTAGLASGFMGTMTSIGGPPMALVYSRAQGAQLRSTLATYFILAAAISLTALAVTGDFGTDELLLGLSLFPGVLLGFLASGWVSRHLDRGHTRTAVLVTSAIAAVAVVIQAIA